MGLGQRAAVACFPLQGLSLGTRGQPLVKGIFEGQPRDNLGTTLLSTRKEKHD